MNYDAFAARYSPLACITEPDVRYVPGSLYKYFDINHTYMVHN